jgi:predicted RNase H-like nuclease/catechol 2,3-dioxygenase-like lactoylglutathione lyase family enzyme
MRWGIDGCKGGWIAIALDEDANPVFDLYPTIQDFWAKHGDKAERVLIDIPIGLPDDMPRKVDSLARQILGVRRNSVFPVPTRLALEADDYHKAAEINQRLTGKKFSKQLWNIRPKILEVDALLQDRPAARDVFKESHPEVVFWALAERRVMGDSKKSGLGFNERLEILRRYEPSVNSILVEILAAHRRELVEDDALDALVLAIGAQIEELNSIPGEPAFDAYHLPMQIVYPQVSHSPIRRINHVQITIPTGEEANARAFYVELLGLREIPKPATLRSRGGFWLLLGGQEVHVGAEDGVERYKTKGHIAYEVSNIVYWRKRLESNGIKIGESIPIPGFERFEFRDPFGNRVEIIQPDND